MFQPFGHSGSIFIHSISIFIGLEYTVEQHFMSEFIIWFTVLLRTIQYTDSFVCCSAL
jgi:hypothetical protein